MLIPLFSFTVFLSAFLLFWVQLMVAKLLLPFWGGSPAVWNTCLVFFQGTLLLGYAYAHWLAGRRLLWQGIAQAGLLGLSALFLPIALPEILIAPTDAPILALLGVLVGLVGLPFFVVSTTAPLIQRWFADAAIATHPDPYFLYAASNLGSLLGLISYPLLIEPNVALPQQKLAWAIAFGVLAVSMVACLVWSGRSRLSTPNLETFEAEKTREALVSLEAAPTWGDRALWIALSFLPSSLLLGVTTYITTDLAAVPLLWAVPLALYLLTFVLAFASPPLVPRSPLVAVLPLLLSALILLFVLQVLQPLWLLLPLHLLGFAMTALVIHRELAKSRPHPAYLTEFYFWIALGGVLGGLLNAIAAPILFPKLLEYPLVLLLSLLLFQAKRFSGTVWGNLQLRWTLPLGIGLLLGGLLIGISGEAWVQNLPGLAIALLLTTLLYRTLQLHPALLIVGWLLMVLLSQFSAGTGTGLLASDRSFFGVYRVFSSARDGGYHSLLHGTTLHGKQSLDPARRQEPLTYFTRSGPVGQLFSSLGGDRLQRVGVLGLGVGTLAAYAEPGQEWTFYEIDPLAEDLATDPRYFTYLQESAAAIQIVIGDGRLAIAQTPNENYDLLFMDAFSSDSIPIHLITQEAIQLYFTKLQPQGILAINITNRFLDLEPVLGAIAQSLDLATLTQWETEVSDLERSQGKAPSHWVLLARTPEAFGALTDDPRWQPATTNPSIQPWTDDFSNILQAIAP